MKRLMALLLCLMLPLCALAEGAPNPDAAETVTDQSQLTSSATTPLEGVLVLDCSGSMSLANTGGGFAHATALLDQEAIPDRQRVVLLLSDGLANEGVGDPVAYAVQQGTAAAQSSLVYTIGLVGGMTEQEREYTRSILAAGYETRYFEVDFGEEAFCTKMRKN